MFLAFNQQADCILASMWGMSTQLFMQKVPHYILFSSIINGYTLLIDKSTMQIMKAFKD
jgi:hypothetical protein